MAEKANGSPFGIAVCGVLGVDPALVQCLTIKVEAGEVIHVHLDMIPSFKLKPEIDAAIKLLEEAEKFVTATQEPAIIDVTSLDDKYKSQEFVK
jgi:ATP-dependent Clp protease adapter protein ClpS